MPPRPIRAIVLSRAPVPVTPDEMAQLDLYAKWYLSLTIPMLRSSTLRYRLRSMLSHGRAILNRMDAQRKDYRGDYYIAAATVMCLLSQV